MAIPPWRISEGIFFGSPGHSAGTGLFDRHAGTPQRLRAEETGLPGHPAAQEASKSGAPLGGSKMA